MRLLAFVGSVSIAMWVVAYYLSRQALRWRG